MLFLRAVDFRFRILAFRGVCGEPPKRFALSGVSPVTLIPQESRTFHSNQLISDENEQYKPNGTIFSKRAFRKESTKKIKYISRDDTCRQKLLGFLNSSYYTIVKMITEREEIIIQIVGDLETSMACTKTQNCDE